MRSRTVRIVIVRGIQPVAPEANAIIAQPCDREELLTTMAALRRRGLACDTDYAGRSLKGQLTHAQRRASKVAIRGAGGWALRERGAQDRTGPSLEELL